MSRPSFGYLFIFAFVSLSSVELSAFVPNDDPYWAGSYQVSGFKELRDSDYTDCFVSYAYTSQDKLVDEQLVKKSGASKYHTRMHTVIVMFTNTLLTSFYNIFSYNPLRVA